MVAKKRNTLRGKASARLGDKPLNSSILSPDGDNNSDITPDPKAFLHQYRETKKEKLQNKQSAFLSKIKETSSSEFSGISKSSKRRRKRKMRDDFKPKMQDLLTSLQQEDDLRNIANNNINISNDSNNDIPNEDINMGTGVKKVVVTRVVGQEQKSLQPGSVKIRKNEPNIRTKKGAKALSIKETERFNQVLNNQQFKKNTFSALRDIIKMQKR